MDKQIHVSITTGTVLKIALIVGVIAALFYLRDLLLIIVTAIVIASAIEPSGSRSASCPGSTSTRLRHRSTSRGVATLKPQMRHSAGSRGMGSHLASRAEARSAGPTSA